MNGKRVSFAVIIAAICCFSALFAGVASSASPSAPRRAPLPDEGTSSFFELIFDKEDAGSFIASGRTFVVTPETAFLDREGETKALSSIRHGSIVRVKYRQEKSTDPMTAVEVLVAKEPRQ